MPVHGSEWVDYRRYILPVNLPFATGYPASVNNR